MYPQVLGVYSKSKKKEIGGSGATANTYEQKTYWFVRRLDDEVYEVQPLNSRHVPAGQARKLSKGNLIKDYHPEPDYYETNTLPALKSLEKKVSLGESFFKKGLLSEAEKEFLKAVMIDNDNAKANLGLGSVYCEQQDYEKVKNILGALLGNDTVFMEEQRQEFNTFGISLRKQGLIEDAIRFYTRALEIDDKDENLHFNLARALYEDGDELECLKHLEIALRLNPSFDEGLLFLSYLTRKAERN